METNENLLTMPEVIGDDQLDFAIDEVALNGDTYCKWLGKTVLLTTEMFKFDAWGEDEVSESI